MHFSSRTFFDFQVTFSGFRSSFLSDLVCSHSEVELVADIKAIAAYQNEGPESRVGSASVEGSGGSWFEARRVSRKIYLGYSP